MAWCLKPFRTWRNCQASATRQPVSSSALLLGMLLTYITADTLNLSDACSWAGGGCAWRGEMQLANTGFDVPCMELCRMCV